MKRIQYSAGFEKFWTVWCRITGQREGKQKSFRYWKRDKLEPITDEIIEALIKNHKYRQWLKSKGDRLPNWCWCQKWLNEKRYLDVPDIPKPPPAPKRDMIAEYEGEYGKYFKEAKPEMLKNIFKTMPHLRPLIKKLRPEVLDAKDNNLPDRK